MGYYKFGSAMLTDIGGFASLFTNTSVGTLKKGTAVHLSETVNYGVEAQVDEFDCVGFVYEDSLAGAECWVVVAGIGEALLLDGTTATKGWWTKASATDGRVEVTTAPGSVGAAAAATHFREVGHCLETKGAGTDVLVKLLIHPL
jgi:hypothetical protein